MRYMSKVRVVELFNQCMNELYEASTPSISWKKVQETYRGKQRDEFYLKHYIDEDKYNEITNRYKRLIPKLYHNDFSFYLLDYAPTTVKKGELG